MVLRDPEAGASPLALFGAELRHYRTAAGLSQEQLGDRIGYSAALVPGMAEHRARGLVVAVLGAGTHSGLASNSRLRASHPAGGTAR